MAKFLSICLSSTIQRTIDFEKIYLAQVNRSTNYRMDASGKAVNSSRVLNQLEKGCVHTICPVGKENSELFTQLAAADGLNMSLVEIPGFTRECWTLLDKSKNTTTELVVGEPVLDENQIKDIPAAQTKLFKLIDEQLAGVDGVLLAGSKPGIWSTDLYPQIATHVMEAGKIFLADYWGKDLQETLKVAVPSIIKINEEEFCGTFDLPFPLPEEDLQKSICEKSKELNNIIVITRGTQPTFAGNKGDLITCPCEKVTAINTTACGDSFNAGFLYEYISTKDLMIALVKATWCAARNAERECPGSIL